MGRGKIEIKKIENVSSRQVTFSKRRVGLFKKAKELSILCDAEVAVIIFSSTGKLFNCSEGCSMKKILARYTKCVSSAQSTSREIKPKKEPKEVDVLNEEIAKLKSKQMQLLGKDLTGMGLPEILALEQQINEGLLCIKEKKEQLLLQQLAQSKMQEQRAVLENETLRKQVEELRDFLPSTNHSAPLCIDYCSMEKGAPVFKQGSGSLETKHNLLLADEDSDTTLYLGLSSGVSRKKKTPDGETQSSNSETQVTLSL